MTELEIYAPGLREPNPLALLESELGNHPQLHYKLDINHDIVYFEIADVTGLSLTRIFRHFERAGLQPRLVGEEPEELQVSGSDTQRLTAGE